MAAGKAEIRGHRSRLAALVVPRPITRLALVLFSGVLGQLAWEFLPVPLLAYVSGVAASFCLLSAGAIWAMRDKADMIQDGDHLGAKAFQQAQRVAVTLRRRSTWRAALVAGCALAAASPAVSQQFASAIWQWMAIVGGVGVGEAAYSFLLANAWEEGLRAKRDEAVYRAKEQAERASLIERLQISSVQNTVGVSDWSQSAETLDVTPKPH